MPQRAQENAESIQRQSDAFNRRDKVAWLATVDPDAVMVPAHEWPETAPIRGAEAIWDFYVQVDGTWEDGMVEVGEVIEAPGDAIVVHVTRSASGKTSGAPVQFSYWTVTTFRHGKQVRIDWFADRAEALEAAGLSE